MTMSLQQPPSQEQLIGFLEKLANFHKTLSPEEQIILDDMTAKAISPPPEDDEVAGFILENPLATQSPLGQAFGSPTMAAYYYYYRPRYYYR